MIRKTLIAGLVLAATATPAMAQGRYEQGRYDWTGGRPGTREYRLIGPGVRLLYPELRRTNRGRAFVMRNFDRNRNGLISPREAEMANRAFSEVAGVRRDRFDFAVYDRPVVRAPAPLPPRAEQGRWDRRAMNDYGFRQTSRGATLTLSDEVLFATDSSDLRPGALDKLRPLGDYLKENAGVRVSIDGYTDSRASTEYNRGLSLRRADAVRAAFDDMGVTRARFAVEGHGEANPVAPNTSAAGMQQNRRVEVTLLGQRAETFRDR